MAPRHIAVIPGDGIGVEVTAAARAVLDAVAARHRLDLAYDEFDWSCRRYDHHGAMMPPDGIEVLRPYDAILLGAVGWPGVPDHVSLWGLLIGDPAGLPAVRQPASDPDLRRCREPAASRDARQRRLRRRP
ncbi:isocitrate/isopropylmalate family dehydrogenase [Actinoplanes sp. NPDC051346]|uniref:isocitrate/isopropylmalate family dehydrogenase n=1 Tax=Actinoplanes sp. NPDC051346 TaxID=3155048 RepID=UPI00343BECE3